MALERLSFSRGSVSLSYLDSGEALPLTIFLHGLAGSANEFISSASLLRGNYRTVLLDQRGHGQSSRRPADLSRKAFVDDVLALSEQLSPERPFALVGQSMGAHTALLAAAAMPERVNRLLMLESDVGGNSPDVADGIGSYFSSWPLPFASRDAAAQFLGPEPLARSWLAELADDGDGGWRPRFDADVMKRAAQGLANSQWQAWARVTAQTLVVFAEHGMFSETAKNAFIEARAQTRRVDLPGASHDAHLESSTGWSETLQQFMLGIVTK